MTKEIAKKDKAELSTYTADSSLLDMAPTADITDIRFTKIKIHQGTTTGRRGMIGDIYETTNLTTLVSPGEKLIFYPITFYKRWYHSIQGPKDTKPNPTGQTNFSNDAQFEWKVQGTDGSIIRNTRTCAFFSMLEKDLEDPAALPVLILFYSTNFTVAQQLITRYNSLKEGKVEPWLSKFALSTEGSKKGPHQLFKVAPVVGKTGQEMCEQKHIDTIRRWATVILTMQKQGLLELKANVAEEVVEAEVSAATKTATAAKEKFNESQLQY